MLLSDDFPAAGFDQPFALLLGCHARIARMDGLLLRLIDHVAQHGADVEAQRAATKLMRYFDLAAPLHHEDEERHVFALLRRQGDEESAAKLDSLEADHRALAALWSELRVWLHKVHAGNAQAADARLVGAAQRFSAIHAAHIAVENDHIFPAAQARMDDAQLAAMGQDMAVRRGVRWPIV